MNIMEELNLHYTHTYWIILLPAVMALGDVITGFIHTFGTE